jgi:hypothetical protein
MNNHLKLIIYLAMIAGIFLFVQDRFDLFDVSWKDAGTLEEQEEGGDEEDGITDSEVVSEDNYIEINIPNGLAVRVDVDIADTDVKRSQGLSGRRYLGDYEGMFFIFNSEVNNPFWMKDMLIPLDILFIDSENFIVDIASNQQPCTDNYCPSVSSDQPYQYVLEVNANFCEENDIEEGYSVVQYLQ